MSIRWDFLAHPPDEATRAERLAGIAVLLLLLIAASVRW